MGWSEGQGLGKSNTGTTNIVEVRAHGEARGGHEKGGPGGNFVRVKTKSLHTSRVLFWGWSCLALWFVWPRDETRRALRAVAADPARWRYCVATCFVALLPKGTRCLRGVGLRWLGAPSAVCPEDKQRAASRCRNVGFRRGNVSGHDVGVSLRKRRVENVKKTCCVVASGRRWRYGGVCTLDCV